MRIVAYPDSPIIRQVTSLISSWRVGEVTEGTSTEISPDAAGTGTYSGWNITWNFSDQFLKYKTVEIIWNDVAPAPTVTFESSTPVDLYGENGFLVRGPSRNVTASIQGSGRSFTRVIPIQPSLTSVEYAEMTGIVDPTSLGTHLYSSAAALISGKTPGDAVQNRWSDFSARVLNTNCFLSSVDTSGLVAAAKATTDWGQGNGGVLLTPRHCAFAAHFAPAVADTMCFVASNGTSYTRTISSMTTISGDLAIATLSSDLPVNIKPAKILPSAVYQKLNAGAYPMFYSNRYLGTYGSWNERAPRFCIRMGDVYNIDINTYIDGRSLKPDGSGNISPSSSFFRASVDGFSLSPRWNTLLSGYTNWQALDAAIYDMIGYGDSGGPNFWIINGDVVCLWLNFTSTSGPLLHQFASLIQTHITNSGSAHTLSYVDLSGFPDI